MFFFRKGLANPSSLTFVFLEVDQQTSNHNHSYGSYSGNEAQVEKTLDWTTALVKVLE